MNRREFTKAISGLIQDMIAAGEQPIGDYLMRSASEQAHLYANGASACDGVNKISPHQKGTAEDIYLTTIDGDNVTINYDWDIVKSEYWHKQWVDKYSGHPLITFHKQDGTVIQDHPHFEG